MRYEAVFTLEEMEGKQRTEIKEKEQVKQNIQKESTITTKQIGKVVTTGVATATIGVNLYNQYEQTSLSIAGDSIQAQQLNNSIALINEGLGIAGTLGVTALVNPALLPVAGLGIVAKYGMKAYQTSQENRLKQAQWEADSVVNQEKQRRLVQDTTGIRIN